MVPMAAAGSTTSATFSSAMSWPPSAAPDRRPTASPRPRRGSPSRLGRAPPAAAGRRRGWRGAVGRSVTSSPRWSRVTSRPLAGHRPDGRARVAARLARDEAVDHRAGDGRGRDDAAHAVAARRGEHHGTEHGAPPREIGGGRRRHGPRHRESMYRPIPAIDTCHASVARISYICLRAGAENGG